MLKADASDEYPVWIRFFTLLNNCKQRKYYDVLISAPGFYNYFFDRTADKGNKYALCIFSNFKIFYRCIGNV